MGLGPPGWRDGFPQGRKSVNYVRAFWNAVPEGGVAGKLSRGPSLWRAGWRAAQGPPERPRAADDPLPPNGDSKWSRCAYFSRNSTPSANSNWLAEGVAR